ncbi:hypothetical protein EDD86DRAFT_244433 [Gorgonomyces haynaldii]|nr:hypothetical protein EDD86DRAFT_244433 [Gorgonomyces haynaldii]
MFPEQGENERWNEQYDETFSPYIQGFNQMDNTFTPIMSPALNLQGLTLLSNRMMPEQFQLPDNLSPLSSPHPNPQQPLDFFSLNQPMAQPSAATEKKRSKKKKSDSPYLVPRRRSGMNDVGPTPPMSHTIEPNQQVLSPTELSSHTMPQPAIPITPSQLMQFDKLSHEIGLNYHNGDLSSGVQSRRSMHKEAEQKPCETINQLRKELSTLEDLRKRLQERVQELERQQSQ